MNVADIKPYFHNAKKHPRKQIEQIAHSIEAFGFNQPIVVDKQGVVIVGHGRLEAAKLLGMTDVPVIEIDIPSEKAKAYRLADNKLNESDWDMELVIEELKAMSPELIELTGFSTDLISEEDDQDDVTPGYGATAKSKQGDLYQLGPHRVLCGSATNSEDVAKLLGQENKLSPIADMIFTDPPYNVNYKGRGEETSEHIKNDAMSEEEFADMLDGAFKNYRSVIKGGGAAYVFHSSSSQRAFQKAIEDNGFTIKNQLIWNKPTASMGWGNY